MNSTKENTNNTHIRVTETTKKQLDTIAHKIAPELKKKNVSYNEVVTFLITQSKETKK